MIRIVLFLLFSAVTGFAPAGQKSHHRSAVQLRQMFDSAAEIEVVEEDEDDPSDPFSSYKPSSDQTDIAFTDIVIGTGEEVKPTGSQMVQISFETQTIDGRYAKQLKEFNITALTFKTGVGGIISGLEEGIYGMKVGGVRGVKVPPTKGYGSEWYRGIVPPNSHLEFKNVKILKVASTPIEEIQMKVEQFGVERAVGVVMLTTFLAISPILEKQGIL